MAAKKQNKGKSGGAKSAGGGSSKGGAKAKQKTSAKKSAAAKSKPSKKPAKPKPAAKKPPAKKPVPKAKAKPMAKKPAAKAVAKAPAKKAAPVVSKAAAAKQKAQLQKQKEREKALAAKEREKAQAAKEKEKALAAKEREKALAAREREKALAAKEKEKALAQKKKEQEKLQKEKEREQLLKAKEKEKQQKEREKALLQQQKEKAAAAERARKEKEAEKERQRLAKEAEKERVRLEKEAEKERIRLEKERVREEARLKKEEERRIKDAEREAYRKAREAEREKLRAEKEAARRALEGKVARQNRQAQRIAGVGRGGTSRVYRADTVPDQSRTTRRVEGAMPITPRPAAPPASRTSTPLRPTPPRRILPDRVEARHALIQQRLGRMPDRFRQDYSESFDMSWIHHDSALEGVVYTYQELKTAIDPNITVVPDSSLQPVCEEIRRHKAAIDWVRDQGEKKRSPITVDTIKKLYVLLHPEEGDVKTVKYRREIPQHRLYFHEYAPPDKIGHRVRQVVEWFNGPEPKKLKDPVRVASRVHYDLLRVFPFQHDSGKVARLLMNLILIRSDLPPVIIHSTERQRYYDALKGTLPVIVSMVNDSMRNALASIEKVLDEEELKIPGLSPLPAVSEAYAPAVRPVRRSVSRSSAAALEDEDAADGDADDDSDSDDDD
jgi:hypothetical protein